VAHKFRLHLSTGADARLDALPLLIAMIAAVLVLSASAPGVPKLIALGICLATAAILHWRSHCRQPGKLELGLDGEARWKIGNSDWQQGQWLPEAWLTRRYAVVSTRNGRHRRRFVICRRLQRPEAFRILSSWIRLRPSEEC